MKQLMKLMDSLDHTVAYYGKAVDDGLVAIAAYQRALALHQDLIAQLTADNELLRAEVEFLRTQVQ
jgi:hypothetical protein